MHFTYCNIVISRFEYFEHENMVKYPYPYLFSDTVYTVRTVKHSMIVYCTVYKIYCTTGIGTHSSSTLYSNMLLHKVVGRVQRTTHHTVYTVLLLYVQQSVHTEYRVAYSRHTHSSYMQYFSVSYHAAWLKLLCSHTVQYNNTRRIEEIKFALSPLWISRVAKQPPQ